MVCPCNPPPFARGQECCKCCPPPKCCGDVVYEYVCSATTTPPPTSTTGTTTVPPTTTVSPTTTVPPVTTVPPSTTIPPSTTVPPVTTVPPSTTGSPTTVPPVTTIPPCSPCSACDGATPEEINIIISGIGEGVGGCDTCFGLDGSWDLVQSTTDSCEWCKDGLFVSAGPPFPACDAERVCAKLIQVGMDWEFLITYYNDDDVILSEFQAAIDNSTGSTFDCTELDITGLSGKDDGGYACEGGGTFVDTLVKSTCPLPPTTIPPTTTVPPLTTIPPCSPCSLCSGATPEEIQIFVADVVNNSGCDTCAALDGQFNLTQSTSNSCEWCTETLLLAGSVNIEHCTITEVCAEIIDSWELLITYYNDADDIISQFQVGLDGISGDCANIDILESPSTGDGGFNCDGSGALVDAFIVSNCPLPPTTTPGPTTTIIPPTTTTEPPTVRCNAVESWTLFVEELTSNDVDACVFDCDGFTGEYVLSDRQSRDTESGHKIYIWTGSGYTLEIDIDDDDVVLNMPNVSGSADGVPGSDCDSQLAFFGSVDQARCCLIELSNTIDDPCGSEVYLIAQDPKCDDLISTTTEPPGCDFCEEAPKAFKFNLSGTDPRSIDSTWASCPACDELDRTICLKRETDFGGGSSGCTWGALGIDACNTTYKPSLKMSVIDGDVVMEMTIAKTTWRKVLSDSEVENIDCCVTHILEKDQSTVDDDECAMPRNLYLAATCGDDICTECSNCEDATPSEFTVDVKGTVPQDTISPQCQDSCSKFNRKWTAKHQGNCTWKSDPIEICDLEVVLTVTVGQDIVYRFSDGIYFATYYVAGLGDPPHECNIGDHEITLTDQSGQCEFLPISSGGTGGGGGDDPGGDEPPPEEPGPGNDPLLKITYAYQQQMLNLQTGQGGVGSANPDTVTDGILFIGGCAISQIQGPSFTYNASGIISISGTVVINDNSSWSYDGNGGLTFSGDAVVGVPENTYVGNGIISINSASITIPKLFNTPTGGITIGGETAFRGNYNGDGTIIISGFANVISQSYTFVSRGGISINSTSSIDRNVFGVIPINGLSISGISIVFLAIIKRWLPPEAGIALGGNATVFSPQFQVFIPTNGLSLNGTVGIKTFNRSYTAFGGISISGTAITSGNPCP